MKLGPSVKEHTMPCPYTGPFNPGSPTCPCAACQLDRDWEKAQDELADRCALTEGDTDNLMAEHTKEVLS